MTAHQLSIVTRANVEQRIVTEIRRLTKLGHGIATCATSLECYRCGQSGSVGLADDTSGTTVFVGTLADSKGCK